MRLALLLAFLTLLHPALRGETPATSAVKEVSPGIYEIGVVRLEQAGKLVTFPATVNMEKGMLEYLIVTKNGPTHESLFVTDLQPSDLHLAMLLLGAKGGLPPAGAPPAQITADYLRRAPALTGDRISLTVTWKDKSGAECTAQPEDWIFQLDTKKVAPRGPWLYSGSEFGQSGKFLADEEGVFAAMVTNPSALINNPRKGHDDDQVWSVNEKAVPPAETPVKISLRLLPADAK